MTDSGDGPEQTPPAAHTPLGLDYFAPQKPRRRAAAGVELGVAAVAAGWLPFACGVINLMVAAGSHSPAVTGAHRGGAALFLTAGVLVSCAGLLRLATLRHGAGVLFGLVVVVVQLCVAMCLGAVYAGGR